jgi:hypothetical protein
MSVDNHSEKAGNESDVQIPKDDDPENINIGRVLEKLTGSWPE